MEDKLLVYKFNHGSRDALCQIYKKYRDYLLILAVALSHDVNLSEDAVHDTFVAFAEKASKLETVGSLKAFLATCVANRIRDLTRKQKKRAVTLEQNCSAVSDVDEPSQRIILNEQLQQLSSALAELPFEQREVIGLRIHGQMRFRTIAKSLGISINTVKGRYRYGISKLRSIME
ncbi:MAG: RNA polymerase sigma factor [Planctomycetota bacterium]|jgi:RNA polymerase sigma-70 factor (ECF subfamily)